MPAPGCPARTPMPAILIHGGAGRVAERDKNPQTGRQAVLDAAVAAGAERMRQGGTALDAVEAAVRVLEDEPQFNAGTGSVLTTDGEAEMDASVMTGEGACGAVANLRRVRYPVSLARAVAEKTDHVLLVGQGAVRFARACGVPDYDPVTPERRARWEQIRARLAARDPRVFEEAELRFWSRLTDLASEYLPVADRGKRGTVGAVACDAKGGVAAATSTGGIWFKLPGRVGDTPLFGAGTWASPHGAASATGHGEGIIRLGLTRSVVEGMATRTAGQAVAVAMDAARERGVECGVIAVDRDGRLAEGRTAEAMGTARVEW